MSRRNKLKNHKPAPPAPPATPEELIDEEAKLSESEKQILASTVEGFGKTAGQGVSQLPAEFKPVTSRPPTTFVEVKTTVAPKPVFLGTSGVVPEFGEPDRRFWPVTPKSSEEIKRGSAYGPVVATIGSTEGLLGPARPSRGNVPNVQNVPNTDPVYEGDPNGYPIFLPEHERLALSEGFEQMAMNVQIGAELFANISRQRAAKLATVFQQGVSKLLISGDRPLAPLDLRGLLALTLRSQEDRHNRQALLGVCARLNISAEELTLEVLKTQLDQEAWRLGEELAREIPTLISNPESEELWRAYKEELGLVKRKVVKL